MTTDTTLTVAQPRAIERAEELSVQDVVAQVAKIQQVMRTLMHDGEHYGCIPGTTRRCSDCNATGTQNGNQCPSCGGKGFIGKASLYQPGAQKIMLMFRLIPEREVEVVELGNGHREVRVRTILKSPDGTYRGEGRGVCTTMEAKYRYRKAEIACPECGKEAIRKSRAEYGGGWYCNKKQGGCGSKWPDDNNPFSGVSLDRVEHDNPADYWNTVTKIACKRADVHASICVTAASDIFSQDLEDLVENGLVPEPEEPPAEKPPVQMPKRNVEPPKQDGKHQSAPPTPNGSTSGGEDKKAESKSTSQSEADKQAELATICVEIAGAGKIVTSRDDFKTYSLAEVPADAKPDDLAFQVCKALSTWNNGKKVVQGKSNPTELTGAPLDITLAKARKAVAAVRQV